MTTDQLVAVGRNPVHVMSLPNRRNNDARRASAYKTHRHPLRSFTTFAEHDADSDETVPP